MKHSEQVQLLKMQLESIGVHVDPSTVELVIRHLNYVLLTNERLNLTAVKDPSEAVRLHVLDSLSALPEVDMAPPGLLVDIGTGGGFPGMPLALASGRRAVLMDSVKKKVAALELFLVQESLESWISVSDDRAEDLAVRSPQAASVVVARAVATLPTLVELAAPLLVQGGMLVALKSRPSTEEVLSGMRAAELCGLEPGGERVLTLSDGDELRTVVRYTKIADSSVRLPRRVGVAQKRPLA